MSHRYCVEIKETLTRLLVVNAESTIEAIDKIREDYYAGTIILTGDDCMGVAFHAALDTRQEICK